MIEIVGFTGTSEGMTNAQVLQIHAWLGDFQTAGAKWARDGMCIGSDEQFHTQAVRFGFQKTIGHPGVTKDGRVYKRTPLTNYDEIRAEVPFLIRNRDIAGFSDLILATPRTREEELRSGTWATIRYTQRSNKPLLVVYPDGATNCTREYVQYLLGKISDPRG